jgi:hypothetical protein
MSLCPNCGTEKIKASVRLIGFPDYCVKGTEVEYCGRCDKPPVTELCAGSGDCIILVKDEDEESP